MKKAITVIIVLLLIGAGVYAAYYFLFRNRPAEGGAEKVYVQSVEALQSYGGYANRFSGVVEAQKTEKTDFDPERKPNELFVAVGDIVSEGDPLFSYDTEGISLEIDQINLEIDRINTDIQNSTDEIEQLTKDMEKVEEADRLEYSTRIAQLRADIAQGEYDVKTKKSEITKKNAAIENSTVYAKMGGIVISIADVDKILSGLNLDETGSPSNAYITVQAEGNFRIKGRISETNIGDIYAGQALLIRSRINDDVWHGTVDVIDTQNTESNRDDYSYGSGEAASKYSFYVEPENTDGLMIGQHVILEPDAEEDITSEGIWLNGGWIVTEEDGSTYVWAAPGDGARLEKRKIETGRVLEETDQIEITSGLSLSDYVAWPDEACYEGAPTTSEIIVEEAESPSEETPEGASEDMEDQMVMTDGDFEGVITRELDEEMEEYRDS